MANQLRFTVVCPPVFLREAIRSNPDSCETMMHYSILSPGGVWSFTVFCRPVGSFCGCWSKTEMVRNLDVSMYSVHRWCPVEAIGSNTIERRLLPNHYALQYSARVCCPAEANGANQDWCETIMFYSILSPGGVLQKPLKQTRNGAKP